MDVSWVRPREDSSVGIQACMMKKLQLQHSTAQHSAAQAPTDSRGAGGWGAIGQSFRHSSQAAATTHLMTLWVYTSRARWS